MKRETFVKRSRIEAPAEAVFAWHESPRAFERLVPPWQDVRVLQKPAALSGGERAIVSVRIGPFRKKWIAEHLDYIPGRQFRDRQVAGPFALWEHTHRVEPADDGACVLEDHIEYALPLGAVGSVLGAGKVRRDLERLFTFRHRITRDDVMQMQSNTEQQSLRVAVSGSSGLVGSALSTFLTNGGHTVVPLVRPGSTARSAGDGGQAIEWDPASGKISKADLEGVDAIVHLAGENIVGRWSPRKKKAIRDSRVKGAALLAETIASMQEKPRALICASAIGYYGTRGDEELTEPSPPGDGFLAEVCKEWERACEPAREAGVRTVNLRIGMVLSAKGGALKQMLLPFRMGMGGRVGSGDQWWSWIALDDLVGIIHHALFHDGLDGPVNATAPNPVRNREFTKALGKVLGRPTVLPVPGFAIRLAMGEMGDELIKASARVLPKRLQESDYRFRFPDLEEALRHELGQ